MSTENERIEFFLIMEKEGLPYEEAKKVLRLANAHKRLQVINCNRGLMTAEENKKEHCVKNKIWHILTKHNMEPIFSGDPRGNTVKIKVPSGKTNDFGGEGIYTPQNYC